MQQEYQKQKNDDCLTDEVSKDRADFSSKSPIQKLHNAMGNQAVRRLYNAGEIQPKLEKSEPDDQYEKEADEIADQVTAQLAPAGDPPPLIKNPLHFVQTKSLNNQPSDLGPHFGSAIMGLQGGRPMSVEERSYFEPRFGAEFGSVSWSSEYLCPPIES